MTIHEYNGRAPRRRDHGAGDRAARVVAKVRALDPHLVEALAAPGNQWPDGRIRIMAVANQLGRTLGEVKQDLATLRAMVEV